MRLGIWAMLASLVLLTIIGAYVKGCNDGKNKIYKEATNDLVDRVDKLNEVTVVNQGKKNQLLNNPKINEDKYLSCLLSSNPLLSPCL